MSVGDTGGPSDPSRRTAVSMLASAAAASIAMERTARAAAPLEGTPKAATDAVADKPNLALVSRHLQWTDAETGIEVARKAGFGAILWTVRRGAHIEPADVAKELPRVVKLTRDAGLRTPMIITAIGDENSDNLDAIFAAMRSVGIRLYRAGSQRYDYKSPMAPQLDTMRRKLAIMAKLNEKYGVTAAFHTHAYADSIGGSAWDLWMLMNNLDPRYIGLNYDIAHVTAKGGNGWRESIRAVGPYLHSVSVKDFYWEKDSSAPAGQWPWRTRFVPPGQGMVNFLDFYRYLQEIRFQGPMENYYEYSVPVPGQAKPFDMLGRNYGQWQLELPQETFIELLKRDLTFYNDAWRTVMATPPPPPFSVKARD